MHRLFRKALDDATGESQFVITVIVDIRGFSAFSQTRESPDTAMFIKRVYMKMIDSYFDFASFYKSTGDGLLLTIPFNENNLKEVSQKTIERCMACHSEFGNICNNDPMIYFEVPDKIGIGVARGSACRLVSGKRTIDYSGRLLNLTARLTDIARPSGIVIDGAFIIDLLTEEQRKVFEEENVYLKGIHESEPIRVFYTPEFTVLSKYNKQPIVSKRWRERTHVTLCKDISKVSKLDRWFYYYLGSKPLSPNEIVVNIRHDTIINGEVCLEYTRTYDFHRFKYGLDRGEPRLGVDFIELSKKLQKEGVAEEMEVSITFAYVEE